MIFALIGVIVGMIIGFSITYPYNAAFTIYITLMILILIQSLLRIIKNEGIGLNIYKECILIVSEMSFAFLLAFIGEKLGISLYLAIVLSFGLRIFSDFNLIVKKLIKYDKLN
jgi:small basic protein